MVICFATQRFDNGNVVGKSSNIGILLLTWQTLIALFGSSVQYFWDYIYFVTMICLLLFLMTHDRLIIIYVNCGENSKSRLRNGSGNGNAKEIRNRILKNK